MDITLFPTTGRKLIALLMSAMLVFSMLITTALAIELPVEIPKPGEATVSEEVDTADNEDPDMATDFYVYLPPDVRSDMPNMGVTGIPTETLVIGAMTCGILFLITAGYAHKKKDYDTE